MTSMFSKLPRYMGLPQQYFVKDKKVFNNFESMFKNKVPFFVSTYQFIDEYTPVFDNLFFDIDSYFSIRIPYRNTKKVADFFYKKDIPVTINFSGGKGFHIFAHFKPQTIKTDNSKQQMKNLMYSVQKYITHVTGIEAYDDPTLGRLHFLVRYPTSKYLRPDDQGNLEWNMNYCRHLPLKDFDKGIKHVAKLVKEPGIVPDRPSTNTTLSQFARNLKNFKLIERNNGSRFNPHKFMGAGQKTIVPTIDALGVPCLKEIAQHKHPSHFERIELVAWLKYMNYSDLAINAFIKNLRWLDYSYRTSSYQVSKIKPRLPACNKIREWGYKKHCKHCSLFR